MSRVGGHQLELQVPKVVAQSIGLGSFMVCSEEWNRRSRRFVAIGGANMQHKVSDTGMRWKDIELRHGPLAAVLLQGINGDQICLVQGQNTSFKNHFARRSQFVCSAFPLASLWHQPGHGPNVLLVTIEVA
jgi:hypothetical protein